jgi:outer membrane protein, heavy metal efflux system
MNKIKYILIVICIGWTSTVLSQSLDKYLQEATETNPAIRAAYFEYEAAIHSIDRSNKLSDPSLSLGYFISPVETRTGPQLATLSLNQMFPWFGTLDLKEQQSRKIAESKYHHLISVKQKIYLQMKGIWHELQFVEAQNKILQDNLKVLETYRKLSGVSYENGKGRLSDVLRVDLLINEAKTKIEINQLDRLPYQTSFNSLLNRDVEAVVLMDSVYSQPIEFLSVSDDLLSDNNPQLLALERRIDASMLQLDLVKKKALPQFGLGMTYIFIGESSAPGPKNGQDAFLPSVRLSLPINQAKYKSWSKTVGSENKALEQQAQSVKNMLISEYQMERSKLEKQKEKYGLFENQIKESIRIKTLLEKAYRHSGSDFEEVLRVQQQILVYQLKKIEARKIYEQALANLNYLNTKEDYEIKK